jgi:hypothetical protein
MFFSSWLRNRKRHEYPRKRPIFRPILETLEARWVPSTLTVSNPLDSGAGSLRAAIVASQSGDKITFDSSLDGQTITLTSGELVIDHSLDIEGAGGHHLPVSISGNRENFGGGNFGASRVFDITASSASATLGNLVIEYGLANQGGGIFDGGANLALNGVEVSNNAAVGSFGSGGSAGGAGQGGGIYAANGSLTLTDCSLVEDFASGGSTDGGMTGDGQGGAIYVAKSGLILTKCNFEGDIAGGGDTFSLPTRLNGGAGQGGGIYADSSSLALTNCTFYYAGAQGEVNQYDYANLTGPGQGGGIYMANSSLTLTNCTFSYPYASGNTAQGGGIFAANSTLTLTNSTLFGDTAQASFIGFGAAAAGAGQGGGIYVANSTLTLNGCTLSSDNADGGPSDSGQGGDGDGGGIYAVDSVLIISHTRFTGDDATGGGTAVGVSGAGLGGGIFLLDSSLAMKSTTFSGDVASTAGNDLFISPQKSQERGRGS